jgi:hypothetical protein
MSHTVIPRSSGRIASVVYKISAWNLSRKWSLVCSGIFSVMSYACFILVLRDKYQWRT